MEAMADPGLMGRDRKVRENREKRWKNKTEVALLGEDALRVACQP